MNRQEWPYDDTDKWGVIERGSLALPKQKRGRGRPRKPRPEPPSNIALQLEGAKQIIRMMADKKEMIRFMELHAMKKLKAQIRWQLHRRSQNQGDLARAMGISPARLSCILNRPATRFRTLCKVAAAMGRCVEVNLVPASSMFEKIEPVWVRMIEEEYEAFYQLKKFYEGRGPGELEKWLGSANFKVHT